MKINWKLRLQNKTTLVAILVTFVSLVYKILGVAGVVPSVPESEIVKIIGIAVSLMCMLGIVVDPTTAGVSDSNQAMNYVEPHVEEK